MLKPLRSLLFFPLVFLLISFIGKSYALEDPKNDLKRVSVDQNVGAQIDLSVPLYSSNGSQKALKEHLNPSLPTILVPVYFHCPRLCGLLTSGVFSAIKDTKFMPGRDFNLIFISFDPSEDFNTAKEKKLERLKILHSSGFNIGESDFKFLTGSKDSIDNLMNTIGFHYFRDGDDFAHTAVFTILTPSGKISHYFFGIDFNPRDVQLALVEAGEGAIGNIVDQALLYCFRFDPIRGRYTWVALGALKLGGILTLIFLGGLLGILWLYHR